MNHAHRSAGLLLCAILTSLPVVAESVLDSVPTIETVSRRLELTPEQETLLRPVFQKRISELQQAQLLLSQATTPQQKNDLLRDAKKAAADFNAQVEKALSPSQKHEWREIRSQVHERVNERVLDNHSSQ